MIAPVELFVSPEMSSKASTSIGEDETTPAFHMVLETTASDRAALLDMMPFTMPPSTPQAASGAEEEAEAVDLPQPKEPNPLDSAIAPLLLLSMLIPPQSGAEPTGLASIAPTNTLDRPRGQLDQIPESATSISSQASPTPPSSTSLEDAGQGLAHISLAEIHQVAPSFAMPTSGSAEATDTARSSVTDGAPRGILHTAWADRTDLHSEMPPIIIQTVDRPPQAPTMVSSPLIDGASSFPDSAMGSIENAHATTPSPSTPAPADTPLDYHVVPSQGSSDVNPRRPTIGEQPSPLTMEMAGEVEVAADPGLLSGDQHDAPTSDDLETPSIPHARKFESSEAPVGYTETTQRAAVIHDTSVTTIHPGAADQRGIQTEPKPIMTQLIDHLRVAGNGEQQELSVQLTPENLGTVRVNIVADQLEVHARLLVENPAVKEILEANLHKLREALQAQGLHVQDISVSVSQHAPQHESMTGHLSYEERRWKNFRGLTTSGPIGEISAESGRGTLAADLCQVDLFA